MKKKYRYVLGIIVAIPILMLLFCNIAIEISANGKTYSDLEVIPKNKVGIVLGTSKKIATGHSNPYYANRINATIDLYNSGKINFVLVSGDNGSRYYNEPTTFKKDLVKGGIPEDRIFLDYAGFRTLDSMVRAKEIFGLDSVTIISQKFHNERAIYIAEKKGLHAIGYNAKDIRGQQGQKVQFREYFARVKVFLDLLLNTQPRFFGEHVEIK
jgi:SanA protein